MTSRRATIKDVAERAGVSLATVSYVINGTKPVKDETRRAVQAAVRELGYRPNPVARSLIARRTSQAARQEDSTRPTLVSVGYASVDYVAKVPNLPISDQRQSVSTIKKMLGGPATNVAVSAAGLGPPFDLNVRLITLIGDDADSHWAIEELEARGVDTGGTVRRMGGRLSRCIVFVDENGARSIVNEHMALDQADILEQLEWETQTGAQKCVHIEGYQISRLEPTIRDIRERGHLIATHSTGLPEAWRNAGGFDRLAHLADLIVIDKRAACEILGVPHDAAAPNDLAVGLSQRLKSITANGPDAVAQVVATFGAAGAALVEQDADPVLVAGHSVSLVDRTGAGDVFTGVFLASWLSDQKAEAALTRANFAAAQSVTQIGTLGREISAKDFPATLLPKAASTSLGAAEVADEH